MTKEESRNDDEFVTNAFKALQPVDPSPHLLRAVATLPLRYPRSEAGSWWPFGKLWRPSFALAMAAIVGAVSGRSFEVFPASVEGSTLSHQRNEAEIEDESAAVSEEAVAVSDEEEDRDLEGLFALATSSEWQDEDWELTEDLEFRSGEDASNTLEILQ